MGYYTEFTGSFVFNKSLTAEQAADLRAFSKDPNHNRLVSAKLPGMWCDWVPSPSGEALVWNGSEKFYNYVEWANYILDHFLSRWGVHYASSSIRYRGEDSDDYGRLVINEEGRVVLHSEGRDGG